MSDAPLISCANCAYRRDKSNSYTPPVPSYAGAPLSKPKEITWHWIECYRYPPTVVLKDRNEVQAHRVTVEADDVCGEWRATLPRIRK